MKVKILGCRDSPYPTNQQSNKKESEKHQSPNKTNAIMPTSHLIPPEHNAFPLKIVIKPKVGFNGKNAKYVRIQLERFKECKNCPEDQYENIFIKPFIDEKKVTNEQVLHLYIRGRQKEQEENAFFPRKFLKFRIEYRQDFPGRPPMCYVQRLKNGDMFKSMNIYSDGQVCTYSLVRECWNQTRDGYDLCTIARSVERILYLPLQCDPANIFMQEIFQDREQKYWKSQSDQAKYFYDARDLIS